MLGGSHTMAVHESVRTLVILRAIVAALGERAAPPWWRTQFLTEAGLRSMRRIFPRTALSGAVTSVTEVARAEHDSRIGVGGRYHLLRLPTRIEEELASALNYPAFAPELGGAIEGALDDLLAALDRLSVGANVTPKEGPISLGNVLQVANRRSLAHIAALYRGAAVTAIRSYPYFEGSR
jgi:hypothetical protein